MWDGTMVGMTASIMEDTMRAANEVEALRAELEQTRNELASYKAEQAEQRKADAAQAVLDKKEAKRHEFFVALATGLITLAVEHTKDIFYGAQVAFEFIGSLFH